MQGGEYGRPFCLHLNRHHLRMRVGFGMMDGGQFIEMRSVHARGSENARDIQKTGEAGQAIVADSVDCGRTDSEFVPELSLHLWGLFADCGANESCVPFCAAGRDFGVSVGHFVERQMATSGMVGAKPASFWTMVRRQLAAEINAGG